MNINDPIDFVESPTGYKDWMDNAKITSLTNIGNTQRLKSVIERAQKGEKLTVAYIGGSITHGNHAETCFAERSYRYFAETFAKKGTDQVKMINAGIGGTPSTLGAVRVERDVLSQNADIVFVEFAVNDNFDPIMSDSFESLVRHCLYHESEPAVVLIFSKTQDGHTCQERQKEIGFYYNLPMISYADGITYLLDNKVILWSEFSDDWTHPNANGHGIINEFISYFYDEVNRLPVQGSDEDYNKEPLYADKYADLHMLQSNNYEPESKGDWLKGGTTHENFRDGWTKASGGNEPLVFEFEGRSAYILWTSANIESYGTLTVKTYYNGEIVAENEFKEKDQYGWFCPIPALLHSADQAGSYRVECSVPEGDERATVEVLAAAYGD